MPRFLSDPVRALRRVPTYYRITIANSAMALTVIVTLLTSQTRVVAAVVVVGCGVMNALLVRAALQIESHRRSQRELLAHTLTETEVQRSHVARQLTEGSAQRLAALALKASDDRMVSAEAAAVMQDLCDTARALYPAGIELLGLRGALECYTRSVQERFGTKVRLAADSELTRLTRIRSLGIFRTLEAAVESAAQRGLQSLELFIGIDDNVVHATLQLDQELNGGDRFNLTERVAVLGGTSSIAYRNDLTVVSMRIPVDEHPSLFVGGGMGGRPHDA